MAENGSDKPLVVVRDRTEQASPEVAYRTEQASPEVARDYAIEARAHPKHLELSQEDRETLQAPIPLEDLDILPSGECYASQIQYRRRLNKVFGPGGWKLEERSEPRIQDQSIIQKWELICLGIPISVCWGEQDRVGRQTWATAIESAKSNALMRCCKDLGIASECWDRRFTEWFKREHCVQVRTQSGSAWRRKDRDTLYNEIRQQPQQPQQPPPGPPPPPQAPRKPTKQAAVEETPSSGANVSSDKINPNLAAELAQRIEQTKANLQGLLSQFHVETLGDLNQEKYEAVMRIIRKRMEDMQRGYKLD